MRRMIPLVELKEFIHFLSIPFLHLNFIDVVIIIVVLVYAVEGYALGFLKAFVDFLSFILSFIFGLTFYDVAGSILVDRLNAPKGFSNALGFFIAAFFAEILLTLTFKFFLLPFIKERKLEPNFTRGTEKMLGIIPGILSALVLLSFVLTLIISLPLSPFLKNSVFQSKLGGVLVSNIQGFDKQLNNIFGGAVNDALTFLTIEPKSEELIRLNFQTNDTSVNVEAENLMLELVNKERTSKGIDPVSADFALKGTARKHCIDMFQRGYFSHYTPEGKSPFDRMAEDNISFRYAGENLALAPNVSLAMQGLMNSPGHKANILSNNFGKVGIGIIDGGVYGEMFCQEFTD